MSGWIRLDRRWHKTDCLKQNEPFCERAAWVWIISNAAWKDTTRHNHKGEAVEVKRGQIHVSLSSLETVFHWSKKKIRTFLNRLENGHMVVAERAQSGTMLTICNYSKYQDVPDDEGHSRGTAKGTVGAQSGHTQEQGITNKQETTPSGGSFFAGETIRLNEIDFRRWEKTFSGIADLASELTALDAWFHGKDAATKKKWFHMVPGMLNRRQQEIMAARQPVNLEYGPC